MLTRSCTADHCTFKGLGCCVQKHSLRLSVDSVQLLRFRSGSRKANPNLHRLGTTLFSVASCEPNLGWLVVTSSRGISCLEAYRYIFSQLRMRRGLNFKKILMVFGDGRVGVLKE